MQKEEDLRGDDLKHYEAEIEAMNLILISIPNDIYNSADACTIAQAMWQRVKRLMRGIVQNKVDRETYQAIVQGDRVNIQSKNFGNDGRNIRRSYVQEEIIEGNNVQNDAGNIQRTLRATSSGTTANDEAGVILTDEHNDFLFAHASQMEKIEELNNQEQKYSKQPKIINNTIGDDQIDSNIIFNEPNGDVNSGSVVYDNNVQQQNTVLTKQLESYKEKESQSQFIHDRDVIQNLEEQRDKLELSVVELKRQTVELQKTQSILKCKISENEDQYHDTVLDLEVRAKKNEDVVLKIVFQKLFLRDIKEMKDVFDSTKSDLSKTWKQNKRLKDQLLKEKLKHEIECCVLLSHECVNNNMQDEIERIQRDFIEIQEGMQKRIKILENNVQRCQKQSLDFELQLQHEKERRKCESSLKNVCETSWISKMENLESDNVSLEFQIVQIVLWIVDSGCSTHMTGDRSLLKNFFEKFMRTVRFGNDQFIAITGYGDYVDKETHFAFCSKTCYVRNLEEDDLLTGDRKSNLYIISISDISISEMDASSPVCLMSKATLTKSWLWHRRLSHLNFGTINDLTKHDLVDDLPKFKYGKFHLCSECERGKSKKASHLPKVVPRNHSKLELLHIDLCRPMRVASINEKRYILVIVDDYSRFTWVYFLCTKDETPEIIKNFIARVQLNYNANICKIRTDNVTPQ
ncbi:retrovirus-related pol polyprotein from transposon TNT 1-94 [Tanacetum coccineum]